MKKIRKLTGVVILNGNNIGFFQRFSRDMPGIKRKKFAVMNHLSISPFCIQLIDRLLITP